MLRAFPCLSMLGLFGRRVPKLTGNCPNSKIEDKHENSTVVGHPGRRRFVRCLQQEGRDDHRPTTPACDDDAGSVADDVVDAACHFADRLGCRRCRVGRRDFRDGRCLVGQRRRFRRDGLGLASVRALPQADESRLRAAFFMAGARPSQPSCSQPKPQQRIGDDDVVAAAAPAARPARSRASSGRLFSRLRCAATRWRRPAADAGRERSRPRCRC